MISPAEEEPQSELRWEQGWEDHQLQQLRRLAKLSLAEKLQWLQEAQRMVQHLASQSKQSEEPK